MRLHGYHCLSVYVVVAVVVLTRQCSAQYQWSGFVNSTTEDFDFLCSDDLAVTGLASVFSSSDFDRQWEYRCSSGGGLANVTSECTLQGDINLFAGDIDYTCPDDGYIAGFQSEFSSAEYDRLWRPYCCTRPYASLVDCESPPSSWENKLEELLNWTASGDRVVAGLESFYSSFDRDRRWRFKECRIEVNCGDPGVPENAVREGDSFLFEDVVNFTCINGYYQSSGVEDGMRTCEETGLWSNIQPVCSLCTNIEFCADIRCTNTTDHFCHECEGDHGDAAGEAAYENLGIACEPLCSWLEGFCYPGVCNAGISSCNCSSDFDGPDCLNITAQPDLVMCSVSISDGSTLVPYTCMTNSTEPTYINFLPSELVANWMGTFIVPIPNPPEPAYVTGYAVGIAESKVVANVYRATSYPSFSVSSTEHYCMPAGSVFTPDKPSPMVNCQATTSNLSDHIFLHADWFELLVYLNNGGILNITNLDENGTTSHYYQGSPITGIALYVIDVQPPVHCSINSSCLSSQPILDYSRASSMLDIAWGGWSDMPSGLMDYRVEVADLIYNEAEDILSESPTVENLKNLPHTETTTIFTLSEEGPYSILLTVRDVAGNRQYARRVFVYDDSSVLKIDADIPLVVVGGAMEGNGYWHNSTTDPIFVHGVGHFYNTNLKINNWLAPVANHTDPVPEHYDDPGRYGTPNAQGVTRLSYAIVVDNSGGTSDASIMEPVSFPQETDNLAIDNLPVNFTALDGQSVTIWFEAIDYQFNIIIDSLLVHIDSTPPEVSGLELIYNGVSDLDLHGRPSLSDMNIAFQASDPHSGLWSIEWTIHQAGLDKPVGSGVIPVDNKLKEVCIPDDNCICDSLNHCHLTNHQVPLASTNFPIGDNAQHDTDYFITITSYNYARLESSIVRQITVDLTPPVPGYVMEGPMQGHNLDYQTNMTIAVHWSGFFDRETAVLFYQYIISTECSPADSFQHPNLGTSLANTTTANFVEWVAHSVGTYYATVVAYNGALESSSPVCSDGITIDNQPPSFEGVYIPGGHVKPGLIHNKEEGGVWLVHSNREVSQVMEPTSECINKSTIVGKTELVTFPVRYNGSSVSRLASSTCANYEPFSLVTYTAVDAVLNITWQAIDNVLVRDYYLGVASSWNNTASPDLLPFQGTLGHSFFSTPVTSGVEFFVVIKAIDVAMQEAIALLGPVIVDISPPVINGSLSFHPVGSLIVVFWKEEAFSDDDDWFPLTVEYAIGTVEHGTDLFTFATIPTPPTSLCPSMKCVVIDKHKVGFVRGSTYYFTIKITNTAGLSSFATSGPYLEPFTLLGDLSVFEYSDSTDPGMSKLGFKPLEVDIDVTLNSIVSVGWVGLGLDYLNTTFEVGLGTAPGLTDVTGYTSVNANSSHAFTTYGLISGTYYFTTVKATNGHSTITASSDGFLALPLAENMLDKAFVVDGFGNNYESDYQLSSTETAIRWYFPASLTLHASHYEWALFKTNENVMDDLEEVLSFTNVGLVSWAVASTPQLETETLYVAAVRLCFKQRCTDPAAFSDGFQLATSPSTLTVVSARYTPLSTIDDGISISGTVNITWASSSFDLQRDHYEWGIGTGLEANELITDWIQVSPSIDQAYLVLELPLSLHEVYYVTVREVTIAGLHTMAVAQLDVTYLGSSQQFVFDVEVLEEDNVTNISWEDVEYHTVSITDIDYTTSLSSLSVAWPRLRYRMYEYSVSTKHSFLPCGHADVLGCGTTMGDSLTITSLPLQHGEKYFVCIYADVNNYIGVTPPAKSISTCSDGITVLRSPPVGGCVQIVPTVDLGTMPELASGDYESGDTLPLFVADPRTCVIQSGYQASTTTLHLIWDEFENAEGVHDIPHISQVAFYEYAVGTSPGAQDVSPFTAIGLVKKIVLNGIKLKAGFTYYASIRATDHVGQSSMVISQGLTVDASPPVITEPSLGGSYAATTVSQLLPQWELINDPESGVLTVFWALGSATGLGDLVNWTQVPVTQTSAALPSTLHISDGQNILLTLMAMNKAGLTAVASSQSVLFDTTPPIAGRVFDGPRPISGFWDLDYTTNHTHILAHWEPFLDPHSAVTDYQWGIGTCPGCTDVLSFVGIGLQIDADIKHSLAHGQWYYISVRGCSLFSGCSVAHSDGVRVDITPPIASLLSHGLSPAPLVQFQASRDTITCHWMGFHDDESAISHYVLYAGVSSGDDSYVQPMTLPSTESSFLFRSPFFATDILPNNRTVFVTLVSHNHAGLSTAITSAGVFVEDTFPVVTEPTTIDTSWAGSFVHGTQYSSTVARLSWGFSVTYSSMKMVLYQLLPEEGSVLPKLPKVFLPLDYATVVDAGFSDGGRYTAFAMACSQTGLCTREESTQILVDSSPPLDGYFVMETKTAADLPWSISDGMTWFNDAEALATILNITFTRFSDPHSGISEYWAAVGSEFEARDLYNPSSALTVVSHPQIDILLSSVYLNKMLVPSNIVYVSLWAVNGVGLRSHLVRASFVVTQSGNITESGSLKILRSAQCPIESCLGHCTCGRRGQLCDAVANSSLCVELKPTDSLTADMKLSISSTSSQVVHSIPVNFTAATDMLIAEIEYKEDGVQWVEWSVGKKGFDPGSQLIDIVSEPVWFPLGSGSTAMFPVSPEFPTGQGMTYTFHARAWYNYTHYAIFESSPITVDSFSPEVHEGHRTREVNELTDVELDRTSSDSEIGVSWSGVFVKTLSGLYAEYEVGIGETPGSDALLQFTPLGNISSTILTGIKLADNKKYFTTVRSTNSLGIRKWSISDGFLVDLTAPIAGTVFDGLGYIDMSAQTDTQSAFVRHFGFHDPQSFIHHYQLAVTPHPTPSNDTIFTDMGIQLKSSINSLDLVPGKTYYSHLAAVNDVGTSTLVSSGGFTVDTSQPYPIECLPLNILDNGSFEDDTISSGCNSSFEVYPVIGWQADEQTWLLGWDKIVPTDGCYALQVSGQISQSFDTSIGEHYLLKFDIGCVSTHVSTFQFQVIVPGLELVPRCEILPAKLTNSEQVQWCQYEVPFVAMEEISSVHILKVWGDIVIDNVRVFKCNSDVEVDHLWFPEFIPPMNDLLFHWHFQDNDTDLTYRWAVGTVSGGEQIQEYTYASTNRWGILDSTKLDHNSTLYLSVVATDEAGSHRLVHSNPVRVDATAPELLADVKEGEGEEDKDYQSSGVLQVDWSGIVDEESGISQCAWAVGTFIGGTDIQPFTVTQESKGTTSDLSTIMAIGGTTLYSTVTCTNQVGLSLTAHSNGITILNQVPGFDFAELSIKSPVETLLYEAMSGYMPSNSMLVQWSGFEDPSYGPLKYQMRFIETGIILGAEDGWVDVGLVKQIMLTNVTATINEIHSIEVRAYIVPELASASISHEFTISPTPPTSTGIYPSVTWGTSQVTIEWDGVIQADIPLYYEISLGSQVGSSSIRRWLVVVETMNPSIVLTDDRLEETMDYFLSLTGITYSGLSLSVNYMITGSVAFPTSL